MAGRVTQVAVEVLVQSTGDVRITQLVAEILAQSSGDVQVTQLLVEALLQSTGDVRITQLAVEVLQRRTYYDSQSAFLEGGSPPASDSQIAFVHGQDTALSSQSAFLKNGWDVLDNQAAYLKGSQDALSSISAYLKNGADANDSQGAFLAGQDTAKSSQGAFLQNGWNVSSSVSAFLQTWDRSSTPAYLEGDDYSSAVPAFMEGGYSADSSTPAYLLSAEDGLDNSPGYLAGRLESNDQQGAFTTGGNSGTSMVTAFLTGQVKSNISAFVEGDVLARDYGVIESPDGIQLKFRVLSEGYSDGILEKSDQPKHTIAGGVDGSTQTVYRRYEPVIKIRHTELVEEYATLAELQSLYEAHEALTWYDHLGSNYQVKILGDLQKSILTTIVEGQTAWYLVKLTFVEVQ